METLYEAWERFRDLLRRCPHHGLPKWLVMQTFYNGLNNHTRINIDTTAGGSLMGKSLDEAYDLLDEMANNNYQWPNERNMARRPAGVHEINAIIALNAKTCEMCTGQHATRDCLIDSSFMPPVQEQQQQNYQNRGPPDFPQQEKKSNLEELVATLTKVTTDFMGETKANFQNQQAAIKNLEIQMGQLANMGNNIKEQVKEQTQEETVVKEKLKEKKEEPIKPYNPPVPFSQRLKQSKDDKNFLKFLEVFKKLHINIPFAETLAQMPSYAKFLKDILSKKRRLEDHETVMLIEECSAIIQNKLPSKLKDPRSFTISCNIGNIEFTKALCDLGASINLMPLSVFRKLRLGDVKPTSISLQLADRSVTYPKGIVEDVSVKVDKFIFLVDFIILDMEEDREVPLILGYPFLATGKALIDVHEGKLTLRVGQEEMGVSKNLNDRIMDGVSKALRSLALRPLHDLHMFPHDKYAKEFGIMIRNQLAVVDARILPPPKLKYHDFGRKKMCNPIMGQWNMINKVI
uniref:Uncharacterized protein LOC105040154 n=1 Tax=Elaeis guineensis var. tenera TaxID=51953 RepID=A0A6I9QT56_ELAGV|nr:uncharacterized protein LOC105040154 [Elaeis guineensis]